MGDLYLLTLNMILEMALLHRSLQKPRESWNNQDKEVRRHWVDLALTLCPQGSSPSVPHV